MEDGLSVCVPYLGDPDEAPGFSPGRCGHLGTETAKGRSPSLPLSLSVTQNKYINLLKGCISVLCSYNKK